MRWLRRLIVLAVIGLLGLNPLLAPVPHRIDQAHCDLIKEGMTKEEVESIFGAPPGEYDFAEQKVSPYLFRIKAVHTVLRSKLVQIEALKSRLTRESLANADAFSEFYIAAQAPKVNQRLPRDWSTWTGRHGAFTVSFDEYGRVVSTTGPGEVTIVPPWQRWWKKLTE